MTRFVLLIVAVAALVAPSASAQDSRWLRADSPGFIVYSDSSEQRLRGVVADLESFDSLLRRMTEAPQQRSPTRLEIYLFRGPGPFAEAWPGMDNSIRGVYSADVEIIASYAIFRDSYGLEAQDVLFHEYAHHFMYQYFANAYPAWYVEGFAEFVATAEFEESRIILGRSSQARADWLFAGSWMPFDELLTRTPSTIEFGDDMAKFYAQSWLLTHWLFTTPGKMAQFREYVRAVRLGTAPVDAWQDAFHMSPGEMQSELRRYLRGNPSALALTRPAAVAHDSVTVTPLPHSADQLLPISTRVRRGVSDEQAPRTLARVRELVGAQPADRFALMTLARAEEEFGDVVRARALLEPFLAEHADDVEALYIMGMTYVREARAAREGDQTTAEERYGQARRYFVRAHRLDENHVPSLYRYAETFGGLDVTEEEADNTLNVMLLARQLAPQVQEINLNSASFLMARGRAAEAVPILRALAYDPHGGGGATTARRMLAEAEQQAAAH